MLASRPLQLTQRRSLRARALTCVAIVLVCWLISIGSHLIDVLLFQNGDAKANEKMDTGDKIPRDEYCCHETALKAEANNENAKLYDRKVVGRKSQKIMLRKTQQAIHKRAVALENAAGDKIRGERSDVDSSARRIRRQEAQD